MSTDSLPPGALDRARRKAYLRLLPLLFLCYVIAYVDRANVAIAKLTMKHELPLFDDAVIGFGAGIFFWGYFLLEIPGTLLVEKWSARKWISRIMISWGVVAALTALVGTRVPVVTGLIESIGQPICRVLGWKFATAEYQFYVVRFFLGLAEAGFFPGVIVYLTHWFPSKDRARALAWFFIATPIAQIISPKISNALLKIGLDGNPPVAGLVGWQWVYIAWGIPAVILGIAVLVFLTDRPRQARWLSEDEREALEAELEREKALHPSTRHAGLKETLKMAFSNPKVILLALAYFFVVTGNYGVEFFLPSILEDWYHLQLDKLTWLVVLPPIGSLVGQIFIGWSSDRTHERILHASLPIYFGAGALACTLLVPSPPLWLTVTLFIVAMTGLKAYLPAFWSLPSLFLTEAVAAASIGLINSVGNLGGYLGPNVIGKVKTLSGSFRGGISFLCGSMVVSATIILVLGATGLGRRKPAGSIVEEEAKLLAETDAVIEPA